MKRLFDLFVAAVSLVLLTPVLVLVSFVVFRKLGRPVIFCQRRPGLGGRIFKAYKFRTMTDERDSFGQLLPDEVRLTSLGRWLRATSLDELPTLWNVLIGDMSLVGPRPLLVSYLELYSPEQARRHEVKPGVTGWAQVNGRNLLSWERKFQFDVWYVDHRTFWLDLKIIFLTLARVLRRDGIAAPGEATMPVFTGTRASNNRGAVTQS